MPSLNLRSYCCHSGYGCHTWVFELTGMRKLWLSCLSNYCLGSIWSFADPSNNSWCVPSQSSATWPLLISCQACLLWKHSRVAGAQILTATALSFEMCLRSGCYPILGCILFAFQYGALVGVSNLKSVLWNQMKPCQRVAALLYRT